MKVCVCRWNSIIIFPIDQEGSSRHKELRGYYYTVLRHYRRHGCLVLGKSCPVQYDNQND